VQAKFLAMQRSKGSGRRSV